MSDVKTSTLRKKIDDFFDRGQSPPGPRKNPRGPMNPTTINIWYVVAALIGFTLIQSFYQSSKQYTTIPYSQFETLLDDGKIDKVWIEQNSIEGTLKEKQKDGLQRFVTTRVSPDLAVELDKHHVTYFGEVPST